MPIMSCSFVSMSPSRTLAAHSAASCRRPAAASSSALCLPSGSLPIILSTHSPFLSYRERGLCLVHFMSEMHHSGCMHVHFQATLLGAPSALSMVPLTAPAAGLSNTARIACKEWIKEARALSAPHLLSTACGAPACLAEAMKGSRPMGDFFSRAKASSPSQSLALTRAIIYRKEIFSVITAQHPVSIQFTRPS